MPAAPRTGTSSSALTAPPVAKVTLASTNWRAQSAGFVRSFSLLHTRIDSWWGLPSAVLAPPLALKYLAAACADGAISQTDGGCAALHTYVRPILIGDPVNDAVGVAAPEPPAVAARPSVAARAAAATAASHFRRMSFPPREPGRRRSPEAVQSA